jgi:hypothetical protein
MEVTISMPLVYIDKAIPQFNIEFAIELPKMPSDEVDDSKVGEIRGRLFEALSDLDEGDRKTPQRLVSSLWKAIREKYTDFAILAITINMNIERDIVRFIFTKKDIELK